MKAGTSMARHGAAARLKVSERFGAWEVFFLSESTWKKSHVLKDLVEKDV